MDSPAHPLTPNLCPPSSPPNTAAPRAHTVCREGRDGTRQQHHSDNGTHPQASTTATVAVSLSLFWGRAHRVPAVDIDLVGDQAAHLGLIPFFCGLYELWQRCADTHGHMLSDFEARSPTTLHAANYGGLRTKKNPTPNRHPAGQSNKRQREATGTQRVRTRRSAGTLSSDDASRATCVWSGEGCERWRGEPHEEMALCLRQDVPTSCGLG